LIAVAFQAKHAFGLDPWVESGSRKENASEKDRPIAVEAYL
jgi:hypothetical protein